MLYTNPISAQLETKLCTIFSVADNVQNILALAKWQVNRATALISKVYAETKKWMRKALILLSESKNQVTK